MSLSMVGGIYSLMVKCCLDKAGLWVQVSLYSSGKIKWIKESFKKCMKIHLGIWFIGVWG